MAAGWMRHVAKEQIVVGSGGSNPAEVINPAAVAAMAEVGIDITGTPPAAWTEALIRDADVVVTMGCGDTCPIFPGVQYEDWDLTDPAGQPIEVVRQVRDDIARRVNSLALRLGVATGSVETGA